MAKTITPEKVEEIKQIAEGKLDAIHGRIDSNEYLFLLKEAIKEIAIDMGYAISEMDLEEITQQA